MRFINILFLNCAICLPKASLIFSRVMLYCSAILASSKSSSSSVTSIFSLLPTASSTKKDSRPFLASSLSCLFKSSSLVLVRAIYCSKSIPDCWSLFSKSFLRFSVSSAKISSAISNFVRKLLFVLIRLLYGCSLSLRQS